LTRSVRTAPGPAPGRRRWARLARAAAWVGGATACGLLGGCLYLRLLELKNQLADFDRYFETDLRQGVKITCKQPVLLDEDLAFFHLVPEGRARVGVAERWHFRWVKADPARGEKSGDYEVAVDFIFVDHKLTRVILPERLFAFVPKHFFLTIVRSFGQAKIDRVKRTATTSVHENFGPDVISGPLTAANLTEMLGAPTETKTSDAGVLWHYRYRPTSSDQRAGRIDINFTLNPAGQQVRRIEGKIFNTTLDVVFPDSPAPAPASTKLGIYEPGFRRPVSPRRTQSLGTSSLRTIFGRGIGESGAHLLGEWRNSASSNAGLCALQACIGVLCVQ
jgi:hypothetical protein